LKQVPPQMKSKSALFRKPLRVVIP
jgi:hypothetical protein